MRGVIDVGRGFGLVEWFSLIWWGDSFSCSRSLFGWIDIGNGIIQRALRLSYQCLRRMMLDPVMMMMMMMSWGGFCCFHFA